MFHLNDKKILFVQLCRGLYLVLHFANYIAANFTPFKFKFANKQAVCFCLLGLANARRMNSEKKDLIGSKRIPILKEVIIAV